MYEILDPSPLPSRPDLPGTVVLRATVDEAIDAAAADLFIHAVNCVRTFGDFHIAMAANAGAEPLLRRLMYDPGCRDLPWTRTHVWLVDESIAPAGATDSRAAALHELVVLPSGIPPNQVHLIDTAAQAPDTLYEAQIREQLGWREKGHDRLDYVLLGIDGAARRADSRGPGGHERLATVIDEASEGSVQKRVIMTARLVSAARFVGVVAFGASCRGLLSAAIAKDPSGIHPEDPRRVLFSPRGPVGGELRWYLDSAACPGVGGLTP